MVAKARLRSSAASRTIARLWPRTPWPATVACTVKEGTRTLDQNADGTPKWRMAPSPHGAYWSEGTKIGYQDVGSWTLAAGH
ncbi:hypothetical protein DPM13_16240 [Paracoccus mutanolyticus]|uniref:Uncharacterized protein n=1 Tax=Paracoccus mutanolyticus TaxID=1499308 RepID=A0ABM6WTH0_9RHOB|nr:hypothetical protein DPM13_16240 [Paracoccus mutanolyticus]